jgi:hypothetical protein
MDYMDKQMQKWSTRLRVDLKIMPHESNRLASTITNEVVALSAKAKQRVRDASLIPLAARIEELRAFQGWMDFVGQSSLHPVLVRAQVITEIYICFVYLGEACFNILRKELPTGSATKKCCTFLTDNPVRAFRNSVAHSNWQYLSDFSGLEFWAKKGADHTEEPSRFVVLQEDFSFWQALARCTAYASYLSLCSVGSSPTSSTKELPIQ